MKLFEIVKKEVSLVLSQRVALLLVVLYPFLAIGLLGVSFGGMDIQKMGQIKVGLVNELPFDSDLLSQMSSAKDFSIKEFDDVNSMVLAVKNKEIIVGLRLSGASIMEQKRIDLFYDNSNLLSSKLFMDIAKAMIQRITIGEAQTQLGNIWVTLKQLGGTIDTEVSRIDSFKNQLSTAGQNLTKLENDLNELDFSEIERALDSQGRSVQELDNRSTDFMAKYNAFKVSFNRSSADAQAIRPTLQQKRAGLVLSSQTLSTSISETDSIIVLLAGIRDSLPPDQQSVLSGAINDLNSRKQQLVDSKANVDLSISAIDLMQANLTALDTSINEANNLFSSVDSEAARLDTGIQSASDSITSINQKLSLFKRSINEVKALIVDSKKSKIDIEAQLESSKDLLSSFKSQMSSFVSIDTNVLAQPVIFVENKIFTVDPFGILAANALVIVLVLTCALLTSIVVILERNQNVSLRLGMSPTNRATLLAGKILGQLFIALVESAIILGVAFAKIPLPFEVGGMKYLGFGLVSSVQPLDLFLAILLIALSFICIGLAISFFTRNQSTAILSTLLIVVPMLFLSGIILPLEFMESTMQMISAYLPLTAANSLLIGLVVKEAAFSKMFFETCLLLGLVVVVIAVSLLRRER